MLKNKDLILPHFTELNQHMSKVLAIIPARGGSKGIPRKNIKLLCGKPLIAYTIESALKCQLLDRIIVSSEDEEIISIAKSYGAEVPFVRPTELALDHVSDRPVFQHALNQLKAQEDYQADFVINLRPTAPFRAAIDIENVINKWRTGDCDTVRSVTKVHGVNHPYWMYQINEEGLAESAVPGVTLEKYGSRQLLPPMFRLNGVVDGVESAYLLDDSRPSFGKKIKLVEVPEHRAVDIDEPADFEYAEYLMTKMQTDARSKH